MIPAAVRLTLARALEAYGGDDAVAARAWYAGIDGWQNFGAAWTRRNADVLREAAKP